MRTAQMHTKSRHSGMPLAGIADVRGSASIEYRGPGQKIAGTTTLGPEELRKMAMRTWSLVIVAGLSAFLVSGCASRSAFKPGKHADAVAEIYWNPNPEPDIKGYRVYYANQADHTFVPLTPAPINQTWYRDTINLKTLTRNIYYQVFAEDFAGNMSQVSDILELTRPDIVPPPVAVALDARQDEENVYISWAASPANDVLGYRIFRKPSNSEDWEMVKMIRHEEVEGQIDFVDKPPPAPTPWHYTMEVIDEAGLSSGISKVISFRVRGKRKINIPVIMNARFDETSGSINTTWEYNYREPHHVVLYRSINGAASTAVRSLESTVKTFSDKTLISSTEVSYHLLIVLPDGRTSLPSETVTVRIP